MQSNISICHRNHKNSSFGYISRQGFTSPQNTLRCNSLPLSVSRLASIHRGRNVSVDRKGRGHSTSHVPSPCVREGERAETHGERQKGESETVSLLEVALERVKKKIGRHELDVKRARCSKRRFFRRFVFPIPSEPRTSP